MNSYISSVSFTHLPLGKKNFGSLAAPSKDIFFCYKVRVSLGRMIPIDRNSESAIIVEFHCIVGCSGFLRVLDHDKCRAHSCKQPQRKANANMRLVFLFDIESVGPDWAPKRTRVKLRTKDFLSYLSRSESPFSSVQNIHTNISTIF